MSDHFDEELEEILQDRRRTAAQGFFGGLLIAVGGMMCVLCGLCSLMFVVAVIGDLVNTRNPNDLMSSVVIVSLVGGLPTLIGAGLFTLGRRMRRGG